MDCTEVREILGAWLDDELPRDLYKDVSRHLLDCRECADQARQFRALCAALDEARPPQPPADLARRTMAAYRRARRGSGLAEWWGGLPAGMRAFACAAACAGLVCGMVLGGGLVDSLRAPAPHPYVVALAYTEGVMP